MAFVDIPTLNGGHVHVAAGSVYLITRGIAQEGGTLTRVEFGNDVQLTNLSETDVAQFLREAGAVLIELTAPDNTPLYLNVGAITAVQLADPHQYPARTNAVVTVAGHKQGVQETQTVVQARLAAA